MKQAKSSFGDNGWVCSITANRNFFIFGFSVHWIELELLESRIIVLGQAFLFKAMKMRKVCELSLFLQPRIWDDG
jgi:hypothetical protein